MKVTLIGYTRADLFQYAGDGRAEMPGLAANSAFEDRLEGDYGDDDGENLIEFAGRLCYESWNMPNEQTATREGYFQNILAHGHESILEHVSVTFYVEGVSRNLSHELIRHRHLSFSELSQRFVDMTEAEFIIPPALRKVGHPETYPLTDTEDIEAYEEVTEHLKGQGKTRKQVREAARSYLPAGMETKFVVTGNLRSWRDVLKKRNSTHADAEMQLFAQEIQSQLTRLYPDVFADLEK